MAKNSLGNVASAAASAEVLICWSPAQAPALEDGEDMRKYHVYGNSMAILWGFYGDSMAILWQFYGDFVSWKIPRK